MGEARGATAEMAFAFETTFGTPPASGYFQLPFARSTVGPMKGLVPSELLGLGRDPQAPTQDLIDVAGDVEVPVDLNNIGYWLTLLFGDPETTGSDPYTHVFTSGAAELPSAALEQAWPQVPFFEMEKGLKANTLTIEARRGRGANLTATVGLMGKGAATDTSSGAGTPTEQALERFAHPHVDIKRDASAISSILSCGINFTNNLEPLDAIASDGEVPSITGGVSAATGTIVQRFDNTALITQADGFTSCALDISWTLSASKKLSISLPRVYLERPKIETTGPNGVDVSYSWTAAQQANGDPMMTVTLINSIASYNG
ncbi:phage tail tube protein [Pelagovum pacificum]|uniref:Phage tail protein n=1 Tax=Pelagovum pacificum TaxID=2588711 RepID=A0A5C5GDQ5_9RHOB|nr:phage tail tube protein [Pelagovum pacificum]QQA43956.1 hypothetical protein I8N54_05090 [Pelagovum pacificum]TNY32915.1 hypothetical protein FHY64_06460 [Pelagovum pacificum]